MLPELARAAGSTPRTLQKHFRRFLGCSPVTALRNLRLDLARRELLKGDPDATVTGIATRLGFAHLGRFSGWYRARFGETASRTLARSSRRAAASGPLVLPATAERPIVAVLPFASEGEATQAIAEEVALALARTGLVAVGPAEGAIYRVRGRVRPTKDGAIRTLVALEDACTNRLVWADAWTGGAPAAGAPEERLALAIAAKLEARLRNAEIERAFAHEQGGAWALTMRALSRAMQLAPAAQAEALELALTAAELAPRDPMPLAIASWCHGMRSGHLLAARPEDDRRRAVDLAGRAAALTQVQPIADALLASAYTVCHELDHAAVHVERALATDGGCAWAWQRLGWLRVYRGQADEAVECFQVATRLDPSDPLCFLNSLGFAAASFEQAAYADAVRWFSRAMAESPAAVWAHRYLAAAHRLSGDPDAAQRSLAALDAACPGWTVTRVRASLPHTENFLDRAAGALESVGMRL
jgi:AraC-like DNA-binding protein/tetratricopeptide (TPR) repeat protein